MAYTNHPVINYQDVITADTQFVDVREPDEVAEGTLPGTRNIPLGDLRARLGELDPTRRVVLLCRSGGRSSEAAEALTEAGFGDVINLEGGMLAVES